MIVPRIICDEFIITNSPNLQLTRHFQAKEFACKDKSNIIIINRRLVEILEQIREKIKEPIYINSGYRTVEYNKKIKGAKTSYHTMGAAADIRAEYTTPKELARIADEIMKDWGGIIVYENFVHIDVRSEDEYREGV